MIKNLDYWGGELYFNDNRVAISKGRFGTYITIGIDLFCDQSSELVTIAGINSKGNAAAGYLKIPLKDIPELIEMLNRVI